MKKIISVFLVALMLLTFLSACNNTNADSDGLHTEVFSYWLAVSENSTFYTQYHDNPVYQYVMNNMTFKNKDGVDTKIELRFESPASGREVDTYNLMISTDSFLDIMDMSFGMPIEEMYEAGQALDLTYYVENHMPNFKSYMEAHPELIPYATKMIDGERKYLSIPSITDGIDAYEQFCGICYRRDWIVKYGTPPAELWSLDASNNKVFTPNPNANEPFSFYYSLDKDGNSIRTTELTDNVNPESWVDNVIFPSGNPDPVYISDWEWMMEIFDKAIADQDITDGYNMSLYYPGYVTNGEIVTAFGGGGPSFYINAFTGKGAFGAAEEGFKAYMQCMNQWYQNGWIDKAFQDKNTDMFFLIDETKIYQGKIALWIGAAGHLGARIRSDVQPLTENAMVFGAPQPINDIYGPDSVKFVEPYTYFYAMDVLGGGICVTNKAKDKDLAVFFGFLDYFYSEEGSILRTMGLSKEQLEQSPNSIYENLGLTEGAFTETEDGKLMLVPLMEQDDGGIRSAMSGLRMPGLRRNTLIQYSYSPTYINSRQQWVRYPVTGFLGGMFRGMMPPEDYRTCEQTSIILEQEYMHIEVPKFIIGEKNFDSDYDAFLNNLQKRNFQKVIDILNENVDRLS